jgi:hypothetical protein
MRRGGYASHVHARSIVGIVPTIFFYAPGTRAGLCSKEAKTTTSGASFSLRALLRTCGIQPQTFFPFGVLGAPLYGLLYFVPDWRRENNYLTAPWRLWGFCAVPVASSRGRARPMPPLASGFLLICVRTPHPTREAARQNDGGWKEGSHPSPHIFRVANPWC